MSNFKNLLVWRKAKDLAISAYRQFPGYAIGKDFGLRDQILRALVSISSNLAEGYSRETQADRRHFLTIALGSCAEAENQILIAEGAGLIPAEEAIRLSEALNEVERMLLSLKQTL